jgi:hypothetical protein
MASSSDVAERRARPSLLLRCLVSHTACSAAHCVRLPLSAQGPTDQAYTRTVAAPAGAPIDRDNMPA